MIEFSASVELYANDAVTLARKRLTMVAMSLPTFNN